MKKILFLLLSTIAMYGQVPADATPLENIQITNNVQDNTATRVGVQTTDGVLNWNTLKTINQLGVLGTGDINPSTSTAVISGCQIVNNGTTFDVTPGVFEIVTNTYPLTRQTVNFIGAGAITPLYQRTLVYITPGGTVTQVNGASGDLTPLQRRQNGVLGALTFFGGAILAVQNTPNLNYDIDGRFSDLTEFIGNMNSGNIIGFNGANLQINKGSGRTFRRAANYASDRRVPDVTEDAAIIPIPSGVNAIGYRNGSGGWNYEAYSGSITPTFWDNGTGTKATVANNKFTNQQVYFFNGTNTFIIYLGQAEYGTMEAAKIAAVSAQGVFVDSATSLASLRATISVDENATVLNNTALAEFTPGPKFSGGNSGGSSGGSQNLQSVYNNSLTPQVTTSTALGALTVRNGSASDTNAILQGQNIAGASTFSVSGAGGVMGATWNGYTPENIANKATDFSVVDNTKYPSVQAVKTYADNLVVGLLDDRGTYNASSNVFPSTGGSGTAGAILKGDIWYVGTAGTLGGKSVAIGDSFRAIADAPGQTAGNWSLLSSNLSYVPANDANVLHKTGNETATGVKEFENINLTANSINSKTFKIYQPVGVNDFWSIHGDYSVTDRGIMAFSVGDNADPVAVNGQSFEFRYSDVAGNTLKTPLTIDYNSITTPNDLSALSLTASGLLVSKLDGSDSVGAGSRLALSNSVENRFMLWQLNASNGLDLWSYNGSSYLNTLTFSQSGVVKINNLSGTGTRTVVADSSGNLSATTTTAPYKVYSASISQSSTGDPTVNFVFENTLGGTVVWTRLSTGAYLATLTGAFTAGKSFHFSCISNGTGENRFLKGSTSTANTYNIATYNTAGTISDDVLFEDLIEFRVYN